MNNSLIIVIVLFIVAFIILFPMLLYYKNKYNIYKKIIKVNTDIINYLFNRYIEDMGITPDQVVELAAALENHINKK